VIVANLDCEVEWSGGPALPAAVTARLALLATTLRVFAVDGAPLWLPGPVAPRAVTADGPQPRLCGGPRPRAPALAWGASVGFDAAPAAPPSPVTDWRALLGPPPPVAIARAVNDRRFALTLADQLGVALPGARVIASLDELRAHLAAGGADASPTGAWVAKAPLTAAGRDRVRRRGAELDDATATRVSRLLAIHGTLVVEPWMARTVDLGQGGVVLGPDDVRLLPPHRGVCDSAGVIRALAIDDELEVEPTDLARLAEVVGAVGVALGRAGYRGPFVVDAFVHAGGLHPLGEINARLTFGLVARAWAEHLGTPLTLGLGGPPPANARPLALAPDGSAAAWWAPH
jgi:hypothetical protein